MREVTGSERGAAFGERRGVLASVEPSGRRVFSQGTSGLRPDARRGGYRQSTLPMATTPLSAFPVAMVLAFLPPGSQTTRKHFLSLLATSSGLPARTSRQA